MRALSILNMSKNGMKGAEAGKALGDALAMNTVLKELDLSGQPKTSRRSGRPNMDVAFVRAFAPGLSDNGALTKLDISKNMLCAAGTKALAEGLKGNQVLTKLNISGNGMGITSNHGSSDMSGVAALADVIPSMEVLTKLTFGDKQVVTMTTETTQANFGGKLMSYEAQIVAAFLPKCT
jgi:hypothetical protein